MTGSKFSPTVVETLRKADLRLRAAGRDRRDERYAACRLAMARLVDLQQFYVAFYRDESTIVFPYSVINDQFSPVEVQHFGPRGLSAWIRASRRTYRWRDDDGALIVHGITSQEERAMQDALVVPLLDPSTNDAIGFLGFLSAEAGAFSDEAALAGEWLARALTIAIRRDEEEAVDLDLYDLYPELDTAVVRSQDDVVHHVADRLARLQTALGAVHDAAEAGDLIGARAAARTARSLCERAQIDTAELLVRQAPPAPDPLRELTEREREIALLISTEQLSNSAIAERLFISEKTVKGHVGNVLRKLGVTQRAAIGWVVNEG
jgi:DNA-binding CsgD family transcriptional regulator